MVKIEFECPTCNKKNSLILMGDESGEFNKKCTACEADLEVNNKTNKIEVKTQLPKNVVKNTGKDNRIPSDYKKYKNDKSQQKIVKIIAIMILCSSLMGFMTGWGLLNFFEADYGEYSNIKIEIVVKNTTADLDNAIIILDKKEMDYTYAGNGTYNILSKPGKHSVKVISPAHKNATMDIFIPPQDDNLSLIDIEQGIDGVNRFIFEMEEGKGTIDLEDPLYLKMETWCPNLIFIFSLIGLWGAWAAYTLQSYNNAQIGAFFSVLAMGFFIIGPILGIIALFYLKKYKFLFTASFKN